ncbi:MAG: hypothetical protein HC877_17850 [Thioploca sp.]|nr:hypothetical protein [Thioploca sp.]
MNISYSKVTKWTQIALCFAMCHPNLVSAQLPESCQDILTADPSASDGEYAIYPERQIFPVYCHNMASGTPEEYLTLQNTGGNFNFSQYRAGGASPGTTVVTYYTKIRFHPDTLIVDTGDQTFAQSSGSLWHPPKQVQWMPYGSAMDCLSNFSSSGRGNVDLTGTPFEVDDRFGIAGWRAAGSISDANQLLSTTSVAVSSQVVNLKGGGYCGWASIAGNVPPNSGGGQLQLKYIGDVLQVKLDSFKRVGKTNSIEIAAFGDSGDKITVVETDLKGNVTNKNYGEGQIGDSNPVGPDLFYRAAKFSGQPGHCYKLEGTDGNTGETVFPLKDSEGTTAIVCID